MESDLKRVLAAGPRTSRELQAALGRSQSRVSTALGALGTSVVRLRAGRTVRYALVRDAFDAGDRLPVRTVDRDGVSHPLLDVRPLAHGGFAVEVPPAETFRGWLGDSGDGLCRDLPWFLYDVRPQGFVGRGIAARANRIERRFPSDPRYWTAEHVGRYLVADGGDLPGNLLVGRAAALGRRPAPRRYGSADYPALAEAALAGDVPGSSAGGEQPKFAVYSAERSAHVLVKFSPAGDDGPARRWQDVLLTEHLAAVTLREAGIPAAETRLLDLAGRRFLESARFDRVGERGRASMFSLSSVDAAFTGEGEGWARAMAALRDRSLVRDGDVEAVALLERFGRRIGNTDMHLGNVSLAVDEDAFRPVPVYDMCTMALAPMRGEVRPLDPERLAVAARASADVGTGRAEASDDPAVELAHRFWARVRSDARASDELVALARRLLRTA